MTEYKYVTYEELDGGEIVRVLLNRPEARNAQSRGLLVDLDDALRRAEEDDKVRVVILGGVGPLFSSGHDMGSKAAQAEWQPGPNQHRTHTIDGATRKGTESLMLQEWHYYFQNTLRWRNLRKITVAQVHGAVYSAGLMLMWACDLIVAADNVVFADVVGTRLGMCGMEYFGHPWEFGPRRTKELMLTGDAIDVHEAHRLGMVSKIFPADELAERTLEFARRIARVPTMTALMIKESVNQTVDNMGFFNSLQSCFNLHELNHAHWAGIHESKYPVAQPEDGIPSWREAPPVRLSSVDTVEGPVPRLVRLRATYRQPEAARYRQPGGAWDVPSLDSLLGVTQPASSVAVVDGEHCLTGADLESAVSAVAGGLAARGVHRGDVVAWQTPNWWEAVVLFRACWRRGAVAAPLHHQVGASEVERMTALLEPVVTLAAPGMALAERCGTLLVRGADRNDGFGQLLGARPDGRRRRAGGADLAVVLFTTGSTGDPKAVLHTSRGLAYKARSMVAAHGLGVGDAALMPSPLAHVSGLLNSVLVPQTAGMPVVLMEKWDAELGVRLAAEHRVSFMIGPPTLFLGMLDAGNVRALVPSLRVVSCGGMGVTPAFVDRAREGLGARVKRTYGSTEAPTITTSTAADPAERARDTDGRSVGDGVVRVVDPGTERARPTGEQGEVLLRGPELFVGYGKAEQTRATVRGGWFATGDIGVLDGEGWLTIVGRLKDLIIRSGENIATAEVERVLEAHPSVRQAVAVGCPDERVGERVAVFVVGDASVDVEECRRWFAEQGVARFKTPEVVVRLDAIPLLGLGKPDRAELRARAAAIAESRSGSGKPATPAGRSEHV